MTQVQTALVISARSAGFGRSGGRDCKYADGLESVVRRTADKP